MNGTKFIPLPFRLENFLHFLYVASKADVKRPFDLVQKGFSKFFVYECLKFGEKIGMIKFQKKPAPDGTRILLVPGKYNVVIKKDRVPCLLYLQIEIKSKIPGGVEILARVLDVENK